MSDLLVSTVEMKLGLKNVMKGKTSVNQSFIFGKYSHLNTSDITVLN